VLRDKAETVRALVPDLVGVTVAEVQDGVVFALVATGTEVAASMRCSTWLAACASM
jgi:hypothetical protein